MNVRVGRKCTEDWSAMPGTSETRYCRLCEKNVHDVSELTESEANELFSHAAAAGERVCVRVARDADGRALFRAPGERNLIRLRTALVGAAAVSAVAGSVLTASCSGAHPPTQAVAQPSASPAGTVDRDMGDGVPDVDDVCPDNADKPDGGTSDGCPPTAPR
jgi:hypothetical protein